MKNEGSPRQLWLQAEYVVSELESQRNELADKIKQAIAKGNTEELAQLKRELVVLEDFELMAQAAAAEAAAKFYDSEADEFEAQAEAAHEHLDAVCERRNQRLREIELEHRDLKIDATGEFAEANRLLMQAKNEANQRREEAAKYRAQLAQLQKRQATNK